MNNCLSCGKAIDKRSKRCYSCAQKGHTGYWKGKKFSLEHRAKLSKAAKGKKRSPHTEEDKLKISLVKKGKKRPQSSIKLRGKKNPNWKGGDIEKSCQICGKKYVVKRALIKTSKFCSMECFRLQQAINWTGERNPAKRDDVRRKISLSLGGTGISHENNKYPEEFFKIRKRILERDNHICQLCWDHGNSVHHINYQKEDNRQENLVCLCKECNVKVNNKRIYWENYFEDLITIGKEMPLNDAFIM